MKIRDYVRYKYENDIYIGKIKFISEEMSGLDETLQFDIDNCMEEILKYDIIKSSPNIIDLIEAGDYVNGRKVEWVADNFVAFGRLDYAYEEDIKSILTKEQFESTEYKVGEQ